jgi:predicted Zn-dependent protease
MGEEEAATMHLESAVAIEPNFENGYALGKEYLKRKNLERAARIFAEMQAGLGDSPELHLEFGTAYAQAGFPERGIPEFEKALAKNDEIRGGHYSLGAAYLLGLGNIAQEKAETEFRKELQNYPDDPLSLYQLASIEFNQRQFAAAEKDLNRAAKRDDRNPDTQLLLGQIYNETGRTAEAEVALRKCVELTADPARNHYQVQQAHYLLARILRQSQRSDEANREMKIANELMKRNTSATQGLTAQPSLAVSPELVQPATAVLSEKQKEAEAFEQEIKNPIADSYNNLGAMAASAGDFPSALRFFQQAAKWNPTLEGLDYNWGRAAFSRPDYQQAVGPLARYLDKHPDETWTRAALGSSYFSLQNFREAVKVLRPMEQFLEGRPQLSYIYAVSQVKCGESAAGITRLENLQKSNPNVTLIPTALAEAYASVGLKDKAEREREIAKAIQNEQTGTNTPPKPN